MLRSHLTEFKHSARCHTGVRVGEELIEIMGFRKDAFHVYDLLSWAEHFYTAGLDNWR